MLANRLKGKIVEAGFSQRALAAQMGMTKNTLNNKINGKTPFNLNEAKQLCEILGIHDDAEKAHIFLTETSQK